MAPNVKVLYKACGKVPFTQKLVVAGCDLRCIIGGFVHQCLRCRMRPSCCYISAPATAETEYRKSLLLSFHQAYARGVRQCWRGSDDHIQQTMSYTTSAGTFIVQHNVYGRATWRKPEIGGQQSLIKRVSMFTMQHSA